MPDKKIVFAVQGEGRGHLTQAIAVYEMLTANGYTIAAVLIGMNQQKNLPAFVRARITAPIILLDSPYFIKDKHQCAISTFKTILHTFKHLLSYKKSLSVIRATVEKYQPDLLINFYEPLIGIAALIGKIETKIISIAHQYLYLHPDFSFPESSSQKNIWTIRQYTRFTAFKSDALVALSFYPLKRANHHNIYVCPPLLRNEVKQQEVFQGKHLLIYLVNAGYMKNIIEWHKNHPEYEVHCFTDSPAIKGKWQYHENLYFHSLDDRKFLYYMANAMALVTTAGFESVCEAMYMGKPVLMVPVEHHFEQWCNARDAASAGAGIYADKFEINRLLDYLPDYHHHSATMKTWTDQSEEILLGLIEKLIAPNRAISIKINLNEVVAEQGLEHNSLAEPT
jgi:uncharacterized protein (TIGR00661 family)